MHRTNNCARFAPAPARAAADPESSRRARKPASPPLVEASLVAGRGDADLGQPHTVVSAPTCAGWAQVVGGLVLNAHEPDTAMQTSHHMFKLRLLLGFAAFLCWTGRLVSA